VTSSPCALWRKTAKKLGIGLFGLEGAVRSFTFIAIGYFKDMVLCPALRSDVTLPRWLFFALIAKNNPRPG